MRHRRHGLDYYRIPKGCKDAGKLILKVKEFHYLYRTLREMLADHPVMEKALHGQKTLFSFEK